MATAARSRFGLALTASVLCHGGALAALAATALPVPPSAPAVHAVTVAFVHPPLPQPPSSRPLARPAEAPGRPEAEARPAAQPIDKPVAKPVARAVAKPLAKAAPAVQPALAAMPAPAADPAPPSAVAAAPAAAPEPMPLPVVLRPDYLSPPTPPVYPAAARRLHIEGTVVIRALVERPGPPTEVTLWRSSGESLLDRSALEAVRGWRFRPMIRGGDAVAAWVEVPVTFSITNT